MPSRSSKKQGKKKASRKKSARKASRKIGQWLEEGAKETEQARERAELEAKRRELRDGPNLTISDERLSELEDRQRYVITAAMNNVEVNQDFWKAILRYASANDAQIIVAPIRYKNPTSPGEYTVHGSGWWWPEEVAPYLCASTVRLHKRFWYMGGIRVQATAVNPLSGLDMLGKGASTIFGHSQVAMNVVPTPQYDLPKCMMTTGTCSLPGYSESKAGAKAEFNHSLAAVVVETDDGGAFHFRQLMADSEGGFYDLDAYYHAKGIRRKMKIEALVLGDTHVWSTCPMVRKATFDAKDSIVKVLRPSKIIHHDLIDAQSISHHHRNDPITKFAKHKYERSSLRKEMDDVLKYLEATTPRGSEVVVVGSNHHDHISRWVLESDWKKDIENADIYLELAKAMVDNVRMTDQGIKTIDPFGAWIMGRLSPGLRKRVIFLAREVSYRVKGIELSLHGDMGLNGARGSLKSLSRIGTKVIIGHSHTPGIEKGAYQVGTSTRLLLEYNRNSPSSWLNTHSLIYGNGKRTLINVINGRWRA